jgi:hypothetical protein
MVTKKEDCEQSMEMFAAYLASEEEQIHWQRKWCRQVADRQIERARLATIARYVVSLSKMENGNW